MNEIWVPKIDDDVPCPTGRRSIVFPFGEMEIGDSFVIDPAKRGLMYHYIRLYAPKRFISRTVKEGDRVVVRVWRIK